MTLVDEGPLLPLVGEELQANALDGEGDKDEEEEEDDDEVWFRVSRMRSFPPPSSPVPLMRLPLPPPAGDDEFEEDDEEPSDEAPFESLAFPLHARL